MSWNARYRVVRRLGAGAAGGVYLVEDRVLGGPQIALKRVEAGSDPAFRDSLAREFAVLASLSLPNVARVYDLAFMPADGERPAGAYFTRAYVEGEPLGERFRELTFAQGLSLFSETLATVASLHRAGVVHGDLKPGNIIVDAEQRPFLIDFGLSSRAVDAAALKGSGTPLYMAPELLRGGAPSVSGDIYALGATLWALVTGAPPLAELAGSAITEKLRGTLPSIPASLPEAQRAALEVALWALQSDVRARAPSVGELLAKLEASPGHAASSRTVSAVPPFVVPRSRGREPLLAQLMERACDAQGREIVLLSAASGMGKSTTLRELKWRLQLSRVPVIEVRCEPDGLSGYLQLLRQLSLLEFSEDSELKAVVEAVEVGQVDRERLLRALVRGLGKRRDAASLVVIVDDVDHADPLLAEALRLSVHAEGGASLRAFASCEAASARGVVELGGVLHVALAPLGHDDMAALVRELLGAVDEAALAALLARAAGNPGLLVEAAFALRERPGFSASDVAALSVGAIGGRLARERFGVLRPEERELLSVLAVARYPVPEDLLAQRVVGLWPQTAAALERAGLIERGRTGVSVRDATLAHWLASEQGNEARARYAESLLGGRDEPWRFDPVLGVELAVAGRRAELACALAEPAAQRLCERGAGTAAARLLSASLMLAQETSESSKGQADLSGLRLRLAELYAQMGEAGRALEEAERLLEAAHTPLATHTRALLIAATALVSSGRLEQAMELLDRVPGDGDASQRAFSARVLARALLHRGKLEQARVVVQKGIEVAPSDDPSLPELLAIDGTLLHISGDHQLSHEQFERARKLAEALGSKRDVAQVCGYRALSYEREGDLERERVELEGCLAAAREAEDVGLTATFAMNLGNVSYRLGQPAIAEQNFELAAKLARRAGRTRLALVAINNLADVQLYMGSYGRARQLVETTLSEASALSMELVEAQAIHILAQLDGRSQHIEAAMSGFERAAGLFRKLERVREASEVLLDAAQVLLDAGGISDVSLAAARLAAARDLIDQLGAGDLRTRLRLLVAIVRAKNGDLEGALTELEAIEALLDKHAERELWWQLLAQEAEIYRALGSDVLAHKKLQKAAELLEEMAAHVSRDARGAFRADPRRRKVLERAQLDMHGGTSRSDSSREPVHGADPRLVRLLEIIKRLARERDEERVLERITDAAVELSGAERGFVLLVDAKGQLCPHTVREGQRGEQDPHVAFSRSIAEAVLIDGEPIITVNARDDARVNEFMSVHKLMLKSVACIPINGPRGVKGVLYLEHRMRAGRFRESELDLLMAFADQAAIALENAELWAETESARVELEAKNRELSEAKADIERLLAARTEELEQARRDLSKARAELEPRYNRHGIVGQSPPMQRVFAMIDRVTDSSIPVVVQGESGTGKELVARAIHFSGARKKGPFVAVNCAAIPEQLLESELFGHVRGAFTGAERDRKGVFAQATGGTLFLDEFADISPRMQIDLLRVLQESKIRPVGGDVDQPVDVRVIVASSRPLEKLVQERSLREDLYYRLSVVEIRLPPLRERAEDIPLLCHHFLARLAQETHQKQLTIAKEAIQRIVDSGLPGNVRQLEHLLTSAAMMAEGPMIVPENLPLELRDAGDPDADESASTPASGFESERPADLQGFKLREKERILEALDKCAWNRAKAASALGIPRRTFYRRLTEFGILGASERA